MICSSCGSELTVGDWPFCPHGSAYGRVIAAHESERCVLWENPQTGEIRYPGRNDAPIPARYAQQGFVRKELPTLRDIQRFETARGVLNEKAHYDRGSGRGICE